MLHVQYLREGYPLFRALGSETRICILELLVKKGPMSMTAIAEEMKCTGGALTDHIKDLVDAGLLSIETGKGGHGGQKICRVRDEPILIESLAKRSDLHVYEVGVDIGAFVDFQAVSPCGIATIDRLLEPKGDPTCFSNPERMKAGLLWLRSGQVEYLVPNFINSKQMLTEIQVSMELAPGTPSELESRACDVCLWVNGVEAAAFTLPEEAGNASGFANHPWWSSRNRQRGTLKLISIDDKGAWVDGAQASAVRLSDLDIGCGKSVPMRLGTASSSSQHSGFTIYGSGFGRYPQGIKIRMTCEER
ncbi:MAG: ArsR/SmtB family transcription factor [Christensenellales bacterium]